MENQSRFRNSSRLNRLFNYLKNYELPSFDRAIPKLRLLGIILKQGDKVLH